MFEGCITQCSGSVFLLSALFCLLYEHFSCFLNLFRLMGGKIGTFTMLCITYIVFAIVMCVGEGGANVIYTTTLCMERVGGCRQAAIFCLCSFCCCGQVGARLISHAGSLTSLAKYPASTVQILGAEKALFRSPLFLFLSVSLFSFPPSNTLGAFSSFLFVLLWNSLSGLLPYSLLVSGVTSFLLTVSLFLLPLVLVTWSFDLIVAMSTISW